MQWHFRDRMSFMNTEVSEIAEYIKKHPEYEKVSVSHYPVMSVFTVGQKDF